MTKELLELFVEHGARPRATEEGTSFDGDIHGAQYDSTMDAVRGVSQVGCDVGQMLASSEPAAIALGERLQIQLERIDLYTVATDVVIG